MKGLAEKQLDLQKMQSGVSMLCQKHRQYSQYSQISISAET